MFGILHAENWCTSYWRILRVDVRHLKELWVWLHPLLSVSGLRGTCSEERLLRLKSSLSWIGASTERKEAGSSRGSSTVCTRLSKELGIFKTFVSFSFYLLRYHADYTSPLHLISKKKKKRDTSHSCRSFLLGNNVFVVPLQSLLRSLENLSWTSVEFESDSSSTARLVQ